MMDLYPIRIPRKLKKKISNRGIKVDSKTGVIKLPKRKIKIPTDYYF